MWRLPGWLPRFPQCNRGTIIPVAKTVQNSFPVKWPALVVGLVKRVFSWFSSLGADASQLLETQKTVFQSHAATSHALKQPDTDVPANLNRIRVNSKGFDGIRRLAIFLQPERQLSFLISAAGDDFALYFEETEFGPKFPYQLAKLFQQRVQRLASATLWE